jgi:hypothetical protein
MSILKTTKSSDKIMVNPVTVFITVDNESMILEVFMVGNRNVSLSPGSLNPKKVDVVFNIDMTFQCENYCNNYQNTK